MSKWILPYQYENNMGGSGTTFGGSAGVAGLDADGGVVGVDSALHGRADLHGFTDAQMVTSWILL